jgi:hypothetical protein
MTRDADADLLITGLRHDDRENAGNRGKKLKCQAQRFLNGEDKGAARRQHNHTALNYTLVILER